MTDENIYDEAVQSEDMPESVDDGLEFQDQETETEWQPVVSKETPKDKLERTGTRTIMDKKILTIKSYGFTKPKIKNRDGTKIEPKATQDGSKFYYPGKLKIKFEEDNLVEYYPNFHYFVNDGVVGTFAKINRSGSNAVTALFKLVVKKLSVSEDGTSIPEDEISDQQVFDFLPGKKVLIETKTGVYLKKKWFRNDISKFVD